MGGRLSETYLQQFIGQRFGRLIVLSYDGYYANNRKTKQHYFKCQCDCGNIKYVTSTNLLRGGTKSCGCLHRESAAKALRKTSIKDGRKSSPYYAAYRSMIRRCYSCNDANYKNYGARGIKVCDEWRENPFSFFKWAEDNKIEGRKMSIDRIDVNGDYTPENCRAADTFVQHNNTTRNKYITYNNKTQSLADWCRELNIPYDKTKYRLNKRKMKFEDIVEEFKLKEVK